MADDSTSRDAAATPTEPSHPDDCKSGFNRILVDTMHYGHKPMIFEKDVAVPLRDGGSLLVNVFRPDTDGRFPVVMSADVYGKDSIHVASSMPAGGPYTLGQYNASLFAAWEAPDPGFWVPNGYVVIKVALRGTSGSVGKINPMSWDEAEDYRDAVEWAAAQPWSSGAVGTNGVSYLCMTQWRLGQLNPPHLKAMVAWEGPSDLYRDWFWHGGMPETNFSTFWVGNAKRRWPDAEIDDLTVGQEQHPYFDDYWKGKLGDLADIKVPLYVCASWSTQGLHNRGTIEGFRQPSTPDKWIEIHGRKEWETYYHREQLERQLRFFDHFLKGADNDWQDLPHVRYEVRESFYEGKTKFADSWPLPETEYVRLYLNGESGGLDDAKPATAATAAYDSEAPNTAAGQVRFTRRFDRDTELTGYMKLKLWVAADDADDMDLFVGIKKLDRRGKEVPFPDLNHIENGRVAKGLLRVSARELDETRSTDYQPWYAFQRSMKLTPGEIVPVEIEIWPSSTLFKSGETLELTIQGGDLAIDNQTNPLPAPHGRIDVKHARLINKGRHTLHMGGAHDSYLQVPVIPG